MNAGTLSIGRQSTGPWALVLLSALLATSCASENSKNSTDGSNDPPTVGGQKELEMGKTVRIGAIDFWVDYDAALAYAKANNLRVWLHFGENPG